MLFMKIFLNFDFILTFWHFDSDHLSQALLAYETSLKFCKPSLFSYSCPGGDGAGVDFLSFHFPSLTEVSSIAN